MTSNTTTYPPIILPRELRMRFLWNRLLRFAALSYGKEASSPYALEREFKELIAIENATISRICFSYSGSAAEFEDLRQDALINKQSRHRHESLEGLYGLIDSDDSDKEAIEELHRIINMLAPQDKAVIMMWLDEMSYDEIGAAMGLNRNTIATRIRRIKEKITTAYRKEDQI